MWTKHIAAKSFQFPFSLLLSGSIVRLDELTPSDMTDYQLAKHTDVAVGGSY